jgi:hypothetical protein
MRQAPLPLVGRGQGWGDVKGEVIGEIILLRMPTIWRNPTLPSLPRRLPSPRGGGMQSFIGRRCRSSGENVG